MAPSERKHIQAGNGLKMTYIQREHIKPQMQRCCTDDQVFHRDRNSSRCLLTLNLPCKLSDWKINRMNDHVAHQLFSKNPAHCAVRVCSGAIYAMRQFNDADHRKRAFLITMDAVNALDDLSDTFTAPLTSDKNAGVKD